MISVPALFAVMPNSPAAALLATNKFGSTCGATAAVARYAKNGMIDWKVGGPIAVAAFLLAALAATRVPALSAAPGTPEANGATVEAPC